ncbi:MAG: hypothetical protein V4708_16400 [Bacteroidota bacterium]
MQTNTEIKQIPLEFQGRGEVKGYSFKQVKRSDLCYIYEVSAPNGQRWYEVFRAKLNVLYGNISYPSSKQFGISAWTVKGKDRAEEMFNELAGAVNEAEAV